MPRIFPFIQDFFDVSRKMRLLSDTHGHTRADFASSTTPQLHLHLPDVWPPVQYLIDTGLRPALARKLSETYMDVVDRYRNICQSHFVRATHGRGHITEYYREAFIVLFRRTAQAWGSQIVSTVRVRLYQAGVSQAIVLPKRMDVSIIVIVTSKPLSMLYPLSHRYAWTTQRKPRLLRDSDLKPPI